MKLTILGTGNATVTECYNTCFVISDDDRHFMVDGGGGNTILHQLKAAGLNWMDMRDIFVTHKHIDATQFPREGYRVRLLPRLRPQRV